MNTASLTVAVEGAPSEPTRLTWGQTAILHAMRWMGEEQHYFNHPCTVTFPEAVPIAQVAEALRRLVSEAQVMRTLFTDGPEGPRQTVQGGGEMRFNLVQTGRRAVDDICLRVESELKPLPFGDDDWPVRGTIVCSGDEALALVWVFKHHAVDGSARDLITSRFLQLVEDPATSETWDAVQPVEQAAYERSSEARSLSRTACRYWSSVLQRAPKTQFQRRNPPAGRRFVRYGLSSAALSSAATAISARLNVSASSVLLATATAALASLTARNEPVFQLIVGNRNGDRHSKVATAMAQNGIMAVSVAGLDFDQLVRRCARTSLLGYRSGFHDPDDLSALREQREREHGKADVSAYFNDARRRPDWPEAETAVSRQQLQSLREETEIFPVGEWDRQDAAVFIHTTFHPRNGELYLMADTSCIDRSAIPTMLRAMEDVLVSSAFSPLSADQMSAVFPPVFP